MEAIETVRVPTVEIQTKLRLWTEKELAAAPVVGTSPTISDFSHVVYNVERLNQ